MSKNRRRIIIISIIILILIAIIIGVKISNDKKRKFQAESAQIYSYAETTTERVNEVVITLPEEESLIGLKDGKGLYVSKTTQQEGVVTLDTTLLKTQFVPGVYKEKIPRQDAIIPMKVSVDSHGGSTYIDLINDRGDIAVEKSYVRLGGKDVTVKNINILPPSTKDEDYIVNISYTIGSTQKQATIPVVDGRFYIKETVPEKTNTPPTKQNPPQETTQTPPTQTPTPTTPVMCTMEAKQCPDGSFVGRSGPKCEFAGCPNVPHESTSTIINQRIYSNGIYITPIDIIEDSRCPSGVSCIWAGRLRVKVKLERGGETSESMIDLGVNSVVFMGKKITLTKATPSPRPVEAVPYDQYRFEFLVITGTTNTTQ